MGTGIHVQLVASGVASCPAATISERFDVASIDVDRRLDDGDEVVVGEVTLDRSDDLGRPDDADRSDGTDRSDDADRSDSFDRPPAASDPPSDSGPRSADHVFTDGSRSVYRFTSGSGGCPCVSLPRHGCPVRDVRADSGSLHLSFVVPDLDTLNDVVSDLRACCESVRVRRLTRSAPDDRRRLLVVDRTAFTDRQYEVLRTAHEMGYFDRPRESDSATVAAALGVSTATFSEHLSAAQDTLLDQLLAV